MIKICYILLFSLVLSNDDPYQPAREKMVRSQIENRGVRDKAVLNAMRSVPRHLFVPRELWGNAYDDRPLPIGHGQTISQPYIVAYMSEIVHLEPDDNVLEIGSGSGYQAAILGSIVQRTYTVEIIPELGQKAAELIKKLNFNNVEVKISDGYYGWKEHAPFDAIIVTAAAEYVPPPLIEQLKDGGRMAIPIGSPFMVQTLMLVEKQGEKIKTRSLFPVRFVPFRQAR